MIILAGMSSSLLAFFMSIFYFVFNFIYTYVIEGKYSVSYMFPNLLYAWVMFVFI